MFRTISRIALLLLAVSTSTLGAQSTRERQREREREQEAKAREIERRAERLSKSIEKTVEKTVEASVDQAMRTVENTLAGIDRHYQQGSDSRQSAQARIDTTFAFSRDGVLDLTTFGGDVIVTGWTRQEARVRALTERGTRWRFSSTRMTIEAESHRGRSSDAQYEITVPEGARVILRSMNGSLAVRGTKGEVDLSTNNGDVEVTDAVGRVEMVTLSGDATGLRIRGPVDATSLNGTVSLTDVQGASIAAESTSGDVELTNVVSRDVDASTVSGQVEFTGPLDPQGRYSFTSHSGSVSLTIPPNTSARFSIETFNGELDSDFPYTLQPNGDRRNGQRLEFNIGAGEARVTAESFSGGITIRKATTQRR
jgi:type II secretory pathway pseudopilin PulG